MPKVRSVMSRCILYTPPKLVQEMKHFIMYFLSHSFVDFVDRSQLSQLAILLLLANRFSISHEVIKKSRRSTVMI
jgi:hypothetical protein